MWHIETMKSTGWQSNYTTNREADARRRWQKSREVARPGEEMQLRHESEIVERFAARRKIAPDLD